MILVYHHQDSLHRLLYTPIFGVMIGVLIFSSYSLFKVSMDKTFSWAVLASRIFITATIGTSAAYIAKQADKHLKAEQKYRRMHLELSSLDPFISILDEADKRKLKETLVDRFFKGANEYNSESYKEDFKNIDINELGSAISEEIENNEEIVNLSKKIFTTVLNKAVDQLFKKS